MTLSVILGVEVMADRRDKAVVDGDFCQIGSVNAFFLRKTLNFCSI